MPNRNRIGLAGSVTLGLFLSMAAGCGQPPSQKQPPAVETTAAVTTVPPTVETTAPVTAVPLSGLPSGPACATPVGIPGTDCLAANCVIQDGKSVVSLQWKRDASCVVSPDKAILQNVVRFRKTGDNWSMSNYVVIPLNSIAMSFKQPFNPGSYELSVKLRPDSEKDVVMIVK